MPFSCDCIHNIGHTTFIYIALIQYSFTVINRKQTNCVNVAMLQHRMASCTLLLNYKRKRTKTNTITITEFRWPLIMLTKGKKC